MSLDSNRQVADILTVSQVDAEGRTDTSEDGVFPMAIWHTLRS